jgi:predicted ABC-type transport system involved in lysophospholipase L1 biosynthesis ATPase subunit
MTTQIPNHTLLATYGLSKTYPNKAGDLNILKKIDLQIKVKHLHAIIGASGSGKSTLLQNLAGLDDCQGRIQFLGLILDEINVAKQAILRNQCMGFIYQIHHLIPELNALENVMVPYWIAQRQAKNINVFFDWLEKKLLSNQSTDISPHSNHHLINQSNNYFLNILAEKQLQLNKMDRLEIPQPNHLNLMAQKRHPYVPSPENAMHRAKGLLTRLGLSQRMHHKPSQLSGGERQRVAIARAFINRPLCIFADEPTGNLDQFHANEVFELFKSMVKEENTSLVLVTHDLELAKQCDVIHQLHQGVLI